MSSLALCMIVKDEADNLPRSLKSVVDLVDEIIIVDTGSNDRSPDIARQFGAKVFHFKWCDDFSAARNFALEQASSQWILSLDADEEIAVKDHAQIKKLITSKHFYGFQLIQRNYVFDLSVNGTVPCRGEYMEERNFKGYLPVPVIRLFRNDPRIRFRMPVHELVSYSMEEHGLPYSSTSIPIHHFGYATTANTKTKLFFYRKLGEKKLEEAPDDFMAYYELGVSCLRTGDTHRAIELLEHSVQLKPDFHQSRMMLGTTYMNKGDLHSAVPHLEMAVKLCPKDFGALNNLGNIYRFVGKYTEAKSYLEKALAVAPDNPVVLQNMGLLYRDIWDYERAEVFFRKALQISNDSVGSMVELAKLLGKKGERKRAEHYVQKVLALDSKNVEANHILNILEKKPAKISLCMIVCDEEKNLQELLPSIEGVFDEIIIVDTGSKDNTREVAQNYNAKVFDFEWCDDFAAARNFAISKATEEYVLWLDADDRLSPENKNRLLALKWKLLEEKAPISFLFTIHSSFGHEIADSIFHQLRLFPRLEGICFEGKVHEQLFPSLNKMSIPIRIVDITIHHIGYLDEKKRLQKIRRNLNILEKEKPNLFTFIHKANLLESLGDLNQARCNLEMVLSQEKELLAYTGWYEKAVVDLVRILVNQKELEWAKDLLDRALHFRPESFQLLVRMGELLLKDNRPSEALSYLQRAASISIKPGPVPIRINEEKGNLYFLIGECEVALYHLESALDAYAKSIQLFPNNPKLHSSLRAVSRSFQSQGNLAMAIKALELLPSPRPLKDQTFLMCLALMTEDTGLFAHHAELLMEQLGLNTDLEINSSEELARLFLLIAEGLPKTDEHSQLIDMIYDTLQTIQLEISRPAITLLTNTP